MLMEYYQYAHYLLILVIIIVNNKDTKYILYHLKESGATISKFYQDCDLNFATTDYPEVPHSTDLLEEYILNDDTSSYLFTALILDNPPTSETPTQALSPNRIHAYQAENYLLTYDDAQGTWRIRDKNK